VLKNLRFDARDLFQSFLAADFGVKMVVLYIVFSYLRPQAIYPALDLLPWTQITIVGGLCFVALNYKVKINSAVYLTIVFSVICVISAYTSDYQDYSTTRLNIIFTWVIEIIFFVSCITQKEDLKLVIVTMFIALFKISLFGARTWIERGFGFRDYGIAGPPGFFTNSGELSLLMAMFFLWSTSYLTSGSKQWLYWVLPITAFMTVLAASSRGSQLALLVGTVWLFIRSGKLNIRSLIVFCIMLFAAYYFLPDKQKERFSSSGDDNTSQSRVLYWEKGYDMAINHPYFGIGYYSFPLYFHDHYAEYLPPGKSWAQRKEVAHNSFIEVLSTMGFVGLTSYLLLLYLIYRQSKKSRTIYRNLSNSKDVELFSLGLEASLVCYLIGSTFMSVAFYPYVYLMLMLSSSLLDIAMSESLAAESHGSEGDSL